MSKNNSIGRNSYLNYEGKFKYLKCLHLCITKGEFTDKLKMANITSVFKKVTYMIQTSKYTTNIMKNVFINK